MLKMKLFSTQLLIVSMINSALIGSMCTVAGAPVTLGQHDDKDGEAKFKKMVDNNYNKVTYRGANSLITQDTVKYALGHVSVGEIGEYKKALQKKINEYYGTMNYVEFEQFSRSYPDFWL